jgi:hypothetical protein
MEEEKATTQKIEEDKELLVQNISPNSSGPKLKIIIFSILGLIFAASLVFIGYQFGQRRDRSRPGPKSNCQVCKGPLDISCPGGLTCTLPQGSDQGVCLPVAKHGQSYTNNQINQECGTNFPEVQPTPVETPDAKWKTYTNEKYEYEVKYPESFTVVNKDNIPGFIPVCDPQLTSGCLSYTGDQYKNSDFEGAGL